MSGFTPKFERQRSPRIESKPGRFNCMVRYQSASTAEPLIAQFGDISQTGMRLISRHLANAKENDLLQLEFTLPGSKRQLELQARVVRRINDFTFAVRFTGLDEREKSQVNRAIADYIEYAKPSWWRDFQHDLVQWLQLHRRGATISVVGALLAALAGALIYSNSDEGQGRELRSWGNYPKSWSRDYWSKDAYPSDRLPSSHPPNAPGRMNDKDTDHAD